MAASFTENASSPWIAGHTSERVSGMVAVGHGYPPMALQDRLVREAREPYEPFSRPVRAVIADDNTIVREGLTRVLRGSSVEVVGCAATPDEALGQVAEACPEVLFLGARMASSQDYALVSEARALCPRMGVVVVGWGEAPEDPWAALRRGVSAWLSQGVTRGSLVLAAQAVVRGYVLLEAHTAASGLSKDAPPAAAADPQGKVRLTPRENEVLTLVSQGLSNREIAQRLTVSLGTVQTHISNILSKLGVHDRVQAALWFVTHGGGRTAGHGHAGGPPQIA